EGDHAIQRLRDLMGATDPSKAAPGTIRRELATSIEANIIHGSDSLRSAGHHAIHRLRHLMGATDPSKAAPGTIRRELATSIEANIIHGSDSLQSAAFEIPYFFTALE